MLLLKVVTYLQKGKAYLNDSTWRRHTPSFAFFQVHVICWEKKKADFVTKENQINFKDCIKSFISKVRKI